jgi:hypothetical protein
MTAAVDLDENDPGVQHRHLDEGNDDSRSDPIKAIGVAGQHQRADDDIRQYTHFEQNEIADEAGAVLQLHIVESLKLHRCA